MNNSDLSLDFLKKCQKCRENGVPNDMAILAALQDLADWKDQHPRKGLWDAEKVKQFLRDNTMFGKHPAVFDEFIKSLIQYMEE